MNKLADSIDELKAVYKSEISFLRAQAKHQKETLNFIFEKCVEARGATKAMCLEEAAHYLNAHNSALINNHDAYLAESIKRTKASLEKKLGLP